MYLFVEYILNIYFTGSGLMSIFNKNKTENVNKEDNINNTSEIAMVEYKEEKWYQKIFNIIKGLFRKN